MTYEQRLRVLAEKMAQHSCGALYADDMIPHYLGLAAIALQDSAEIAKDCYEHGYNVCSAGCGSHANLYINSLGLVPDKTK